MSLESVLIILLVGAICGWLATIVVGQYGFGLLFNIVIGILGGLLGTWLFPKLGIVIGRGLPGSILNTPLREFLSAVGVIVFQRIGFMPRRNLR